MINRKKQRFNRTDREDEEERSYPIGRFLLLFFLLLVIHNYANRSLPSQEEYPPVEESEEPFELDEASFSTDFSMMEREQFWEEEGMHPLRLWEDPQYLALQPDTALGRVIAQLLERHHPDGAFWMLSDGKSNRLLAWGQYSDSTLQRDPEFASRTTFPAASIAKIVTAAAAFESGRYSPESTQRLVGRSTTLYNRQLRVHASEGHPVSLTRAFALSMNAPMALFGRELGAQRLKKTAKKLGFNLQLSPQLPLQSQYAPPDTGYGLAEAACGFTRSITLSPLQASGMAYTVFTGKPWTPAWSPNGPQNRFPDRPISPQPALDRQTIAHLRTLFDATATSGTSRSALRKTIYSNYRSRVAVGGKTGSLDGRDPWGRYDWFVGYAYDKNDRENGVIITVMQYHRRLRSLPASQVAGVLVNHWAKYYLDRNKSVGS